MKTKSTFRLTQWLLAAFIGVCSLLSFVSCSSDEDEMYIDYYVAVQSRVDIFDRGEGVLPTSSTEAAIGTTIKLMREGIKDVYPVKNMQGNDSQVIRVCDQAYYQYAAGHNEAILCTVQLFKVLRAGTLIKERRCLKCYTL